jgi:hypothetical protein
MPGTNDLWSTWKNTPSKSRFNRPKRSGKRPFQASSPLQKTRPLQSFIVRPREPPLPTTPIDSAAHTLNRRLQVPGRRLFIGGDRSVHRTLVLRSSMVLILFLLVIAVFWLDRDGLRDNIDSSITFIDVVYFTMVSVTTVGYGDMVPVTADAGSCGDPQSSCSR